MANEWQGVIHSTAPKYLKGAEDLTIRERIVLSFLKSRGRVKFNENSHTCVWDVEFSEPPIEPYADGGVLNFQRHDPLRQLVLDWRGYVGTDQMTRKERMMNTGDEAIYRRYDKIIPNLTRSITNKFGSEWLIDGYAVRHLRHAIDCLAESGRLLVGSFGFWRATVPRRIDDD